MKDLIRQGDILFVPVEKLPEDCKKQDNGVIAKGEATGHHHQLAVVEDAEIYNVGWRGDEKYLKVGPNGVSIVHEEHQTVTLPSDTIYRIHQAREYNYAQNLVGFVRD